MNIAVRLRTMQYYQRTLKRTITCSGIGLHSGKRVNMALKPAPENHGIVFVRTDLDGAECKARVESIAETSFATILKQGNAEVRTTEHFLAACSALSIDNLTVELDAPEVPIMDGSAAPFVYLLLEGGVVEQARARKYLKITENFDWMEGGKRVSLSPAPGFEIECLIAFDHPLIGRQHYAGPVTERRFARELAPARTFTFLKDVEALRRRGLALGGSLDNAVVLGDNKFLNPHLRYKDEFVRHKAMDAIGDFTLLGLPLWGKLRVEKAGHAAHAAAMRVLKDSNCWSVVDAPEPFKMLPDMAPAPASARV
jgi:UDP-3-O-[3-hydroxymyristoyl] N-acetylglucosamine deacetylase